MDFISIETIAKKGSAADSRLRWCHQGGLAAWTAFL